MRYFKSILCTACATFILAGCSYFDTGEAIELQAEDPVHIDLMHAEQSAEELTDVSTVVRSSTNGNVEVFSLDGEVVKQSVDGVETYLPTVVKPISAPSLGSGSVMSNPNVEVFPLDGALMIPSPMSAPSLTSFVSLTPRAEPVEHVMMQEMAKNKAGPMPVLTPVLGSNISSAPAALEVTTRSAEKASATLYFDHDSKNLDQAGRDQVELIVQNFDASYGKGITVEGHASSNADYSDIIQRQMVNLKVSMDRALSVVHSLVEGGIPAEAIRTVAWGEVHPPKSVGDKDEESAARRVEIIAQ